ncbi:MAG: tetratricopeptide repeat protein [Bdellovibrionota bacterium]
MKSKRRISVVAGKLSTPRLLKQFEPLAKNFSINAFVFNNKHILDNHDTCIRLFIYDEVENMPGYMRGLEDELRKSDIVIALETTSLASFQACRIAKKYKKIFIIYSTENDFSIYHKYPNIKAIQYDILNNSDHFIAATNDSYNALCQCNIDVEKCSIAPYFPNESKFSIDKIAKSRFRKYIGVSDDDIILFYYSNSDYESGVQKVLKTTKLLIENVKNGEKIRIIIAAESMHDYLEPKYLAYDLGIGSSVYFLHQDIESFAKDLFNAVDFSLHFKESFDENYSSTKGSVFQILDLMACGVVPVVAQGSFEFSLTSGMAVSVTNATYDEYAMALGQMICSQEIHNMKKQAIEEGFEKYRQYPNLSDVIERVIELSKEGPGGFVADLVDANIKNISIEIAKGNLEIAMIEIERLLLEVHEDGPDYSELLRLKGDAIYSLAKYEQALECYQKSLEIDAKNHHAFRGLGFVAWQSHSHEEAMAFFKKSLVISERNPQAMMGLGLVYMRVGAFSQSIYWFEKSLLSDMDSGTCLMALIQACVECQDTKIAIASLERIMELIGEKRSLLIGLGSLYMRAGRASEGQQLVHRAFEQVS